MKPRPVGRPRRAKKAAETRITIRLTEQEAGRWSKFAAARGWSASRLVRECVEMALSPG